ncbi:hypothetical protein SAMN05192550_1700 [Flavobacterium glycines]|uniref:Zinc-ribbon 15 domain-containing protein n=2 Tax=Flavobacterium glycines TaxID=551990 RepID=A0A511CDI8_9FLAO|nr:hypothetical protein [Flavobacterium glycines]GEL09304.1 hypothetical protein FGL01_00430 [Flavobacterium glycines]SDJ11752.1 hypothetical protein SAMN05192550_1700 [Flavobacterium glycines]
MMVLVGTQTTLIQEGQLSDIDCTNCSCKDSLHFQIYSKYVHITMIPLFAVGKIFECECSNCNKEFDFEDFSENEKQKILNQKEIKEAETPWWTYSGIVILLGLIIFSINSYFDNDKLTKERINTPTTGDVYVLKLDTGYYSTLKIDTITHDSIYTTENDFKSYLSSDIDDIDTPENYTTQKEAYSKKELIELFEKDIITSIKRKE